MAKNTIQPEHFQPLPQPEGPQVLGTTLGIGAVRSAEIAAIADINADRSIREIHLANQLAETKVHPRKAGVAEKIGGILRGKIMSDSEVRLFDRATKHNRGPGAHRWDRDSALDQQEIELTAARTRIGAITDPDDVLTFETFMDRNTPMLLLSQKYRFQVDTGTSMTWVEWLSNPENATDDQLLNILQWNAANVEQAEQSKSFKHKEMIRREIFGDKVCRGVEQGWLSGDSVFKLGSLEKTKIRVGDVFDTHFSERSAYYTTDGPLVVFGQGLTAGKNPALSAVLVMADAYDHEASHATIGQDWHREEALVHKDLKHRWFDEAMTEHVAQVFKGGDLHNLLPDDNAVYLPERHLLDVLLTEGRHPIDITLATKAYSGNIRDQEAFVAAVESAWHPGLLGEINTRIAKQVAKRSATSDKSPLKQEQDAITEVADRLRVVGRERLQQKAA